MSTFALATIIACVTIVVLTVLIIWLRQARKARPQPDMYAKAATTIVTPTGRISFPEGLGKARVVGKVPELGYGYNTKGRRFPKRHD